MSTLDWQLIIELFKVCIDAVQSYGVGIRHELLPIRNRRHHVARGRISANLH